MSGSFKKAEFESQGQGKVMDSKGWLSVEWGCPRKPPELFTACPGWTETF